MNPNHPVKNIMTSNPMTININDPLESVKNIFENNDFHHIPVVDAGSKVVGIISREDWLKRLNQMAMETTGQTWIDIQYKHQPVKEIMTSQPVSIDPDDSIGLAADIFLANTFHALPVIEDNQLLGILTSHDLLKYAYTSAV